MENNGQAATGCNREAAHIKQQQSHFTGTVKRLKLKFIRMVAWWRIAWGTLI
jgi:hypothetical protein